MLYLLLFHVLDVIILVRGIIIFIYVSLWDTVTVTTSIQITPLLTTLTLPLTIQTMDVCLCVHLSDRRTDGRNESRAVSAWLPYSVKLFSQHTIPAFLPSFMNSFPTIPFFISSSYFLLPACSRHYSHASHNSIQLSPVPLFCFKDLHRISLHCVALISFYAFITSNIHKTN